MILANHNTRGYYQAIGIPGAMPFKFLAKSSVSAIPVLASIAARCAILVDRNSVSVKSRQKKPCYKPCLTASRY